MHMLYDSTRCKAETLLESSLRNFCIVGEPTYPYTECGTWLGHPTSKATWTLLFSMPCCWSNYKVDSEVSQPRYAGRMIVEGVDDDHGNTT